MRSPLAEPDTAVAPAPGRTGEPLPERAPEPEQRRWRKHPWLGLSVTILFASLAALSTVIIWLVRAKEPATSKILTTSSPTTADAAGVLRLKGTTQAVRTRSIQAPLLAGEKEGTLTITNLRPAGSSVKAGRPAGGI